MPRKPKHKGIFAKFYITDNILEVVANERNKKEATTISAVTAAAEKTPPLRK